MNEKTENHRTISENKKILSALKILPFVFALHNVEEAWYISRYEQAALTPLVITPFQFIIAVSLFTLLGFALVYGEKYYPSPQTYLYTVTGFSGMLFLNTFFPHILSAIFLSSYTPGIITAVLLILPCTTLILWEIFKGNYLTDKQLISTILIGGAAGIGFVTLFLGIGYIFSVYIY